MRINQILSSYIRRNHKRFLMKPVDGHFGSLSGKKKPSNTNRKSWQTDKKLIKLKRQE